LKGIADEHQGKEFTIIGISMDENVTNLHRYLARKGIDWPQVCDGQGRTSKLTRLFNAWSFPRHIIIDRDGRIVFNFSGAKGVPKVSRMVAEVMRN